MARTLINPADQIPAASLTRVMMNVATAGKAVITKVIAGNNITISNTGIDSGTGDVTINAVGSEISVSINQIYFTANGTYTPTPGVRFILVEMLGGSGGSGGCPSPGAGKYAISGAGCGGVYLRFWSPPVAAQSVTIGAGGIAGTASTVGGNGGNGGNSIFAGCTAGGGFGGIQGVATVAPFKVAGATNTNGFIIAASISAYMAIAGQPGGTGYALATPLMVGGEGGGSIYGEGGGSNILLAAASSLAGTPGLGFGAGAGSAMVATTGAFVSGAPGQHGFVQITEFF